MKTKISKKIMVVVLALAMVLQVTPAFAVETGSVETGNEDEKKTTISIDLSSVNIPGGSTERRCDITAFSGKLIDIDQTNINSIYAKIFVDNTEKQVDCPGKSARLTLNEDDLKKMSLGPHEVTVKFYLEGNPHDMVSGSFILRAKNPKHLIFNAEDKIKANGYVGQSLKDIKITSSAVYTTNLQNFVKMDEVSGKWKFLQSDAEKVFPTQGGTTSYEATFIPDKDPYTYDELTCEVIPNMNSKKTIVLSTKNTKVTFDEESYVYTGKEITPTITVNYDNNPLTENTDYEVDITKNINVGEATATIKGIGKYSGTFEEKFNIIQSDTTFNGTLKTYKNNEETKAFAYGDTITVKATPQATGTAPTTRSFLRSFTAPTANQMALFMGNTQISDAVNAVNGTYTMTYNTANKKLAIGTNTITAKYVGNTNMADFKEDVTVTLNKKPITATVNSNVTKIYDGNTNFTDVTLTLTGLENDDTVTATATGTRASADVNGTATFTVTSVTLDGTNKEYYSLANGDVTGTVAITKADYPEAKTTTSAKYGNEGKINIENLLADGYKIGTITITGDETIITETPTVEGTVVSYKLAGDSSKVNSTATITIPVTASTNYKEYNVVITVTVTDKNVPDLTAENIKVTYTGEALKNSVIKGTATFEGEAVAGTWAFKDGETLTTVANSGNKVVVFTPTNTDDFKDGKVTINVIIEKATPTGTPNFKPITEKDKKLSDVDLKVGTIKPEGTIKWDSENETVVVMDAKYKWTFTPTDSANYDNLTGEVVLWKKPTPPSIGGGGGGILPPAKPETKPEVKPEVKPDTKPTPENPKPPTEVVTTVKPTVSGDTVKAEVSSKDVDTAIETAKKEADKNGTKDNGIVVEIKVDAKDTNAKNITTSIPKSSVDALVKAGVKEVKVTSEVADINLNIDTLKELQKQAVTDVSVSASKVDNTKLPTAAKKLVGDRPVFDFAITSTSGKKVTDFGKGEVEVAIPYTLGKNEKSSNIVVYYIDGNNKVSEMKGAFYDKETKTVKFKTDHFSKFAIGYREKSIKDLDLRLTSTATKGKIKITWKGSDANLVDGYEVHRSTKKYSGFGKTPYYKTSNENKITYTNTKGLKKGTRYYYKVRVYKYVDGKKIYSDWSTKAYRIAK